MERETIDTLESMGGFSFLFWEPTQKSRDDESIYETAEMPDGMSDDV